MSLSARNQNFSYRNDIRANDIFTQLLTVTDGNVLPFEQIDSPVQKEGSIAYDSTLEKIIYSNGNEWVAVTPSGEAVTLVNTGIGLTGGPITNTGTISLGNTLVTPGNYTSANITVDQQGRLTSASNGGSSVQAWQAVADTTIPSQINIEYNTPTVNLTDAFVTNSLTTEGSGTRLQFTQDGALRAGTVSFTQWNSLNRGSNSFCANQNNIASAQNSVCMGNGGNVSSVASSVLGGTDNTISEDGQNSVICGGSTNTIYPDGTGNNAIIGGNNNSIASTSAATSSTIIGGTINICDGTNNVILGGNNNSIGNVSSSIVGGSNAVSNFNNTFVFSDGSSGTVQSLNSDQFVISAANGTLIQNVTGSKGIGMNITNGTSPTHYIDARNNGALAIAVTSYAAGLNEPIFLTQRAAGTQNAPLALDNTESYILGALITRGYDGTSFADSATILGRSQSAWSPTDHNGYLTFNTTNVGTTAVTERMRITPAGVVSINEAVPDGRAILEAVNSSAEPYNTYIHGTITAIDLSNNQIGILLTPTYNPTSGASGTCAGIINNPTFTAPVAQTITQAIAYHANAFTAGNIGTITNVYNFYSGVGNGPAGTITNAYGGYFLLPVYGTNATAMYTDSLTVGATNLGRQTKGTIITAPPASSASALALGSTYRNNLTYDAQLTVYINITVNTTGTILCGVGPTDPPLQQTLMTGITTLGIFPVSVTVPSGYFVLLSTTGITATIVGQQFTPL